MGSEMCIRDSIQAGRKSENLVGRLDIDARCVELSRIKLGYILLEARLAYIRPDIVEEISVVLGGGRICDKHRVDLPLVVVIDGVELDYRIVYESARGAVIEELAEYLVRAAGAVTVDYTVTVKRLD